MKPHEAIQLLLELVPAAVIIWRVAEAKSQIIKYIDSSLVPRDSRISEIEKEMEIHFCQYEERKEFVNYLINGLDEKVNHKFNRCFEEIKNLKQ